MPAEQPSERPSSVARQSGVWNWLGFFLLVFAVTGLAFYLAGAAGLDGGNSSAQ
jgi:hypothetical protein